MAETTGAPTKPGRRTGGRLQIRFTQGLILLNIIVVTIITAAEYRHGSALAGPDSLFAEAVLALAVFGVIYVAVLLIVFARFEHDPTWTLLPITFLLPLTVLAIFEAAGHGGPIGPVVARGVFMAGFVASYFLLRTQHRPSFD